jgi:hypothetical protein
MVVNRGVFVPWLVSREMKFSLAHFMHSVYTRPVLAGIPAAALACTLRFTLLPGISWFQLFAASALVTPTYFLTAFFFCMPPDHRSRVHALVLQRLPFTRLRTA